VENSITSFTAARDRSADGVEFDVQLTSDGRVIVMHDPTLDRTTTCNGSVAARSLAELGACTLNNGEPIRTLDEVLFTIGPWFSYLFVEIKADSDDRLLERSHATAGIVLASGFAERIIVISYDTTVLETLVTYRDAGVHVGWDSDSNESIAKAARSGADWALMRVDGLEPRDGDIVAGLGQALAVYGISSPTHFTTAARAGVRVMMTDNLETVAALIGRRPDPQLATTPPRVTTDAE
jgi:glycerophosphoryl diester phosphodiesterase